MPLHDDWNVAGASENTVREVDCIRGFNVLRLCCKSCDLTGRIAEFEFGRSE